MGPVNAQMGYQCTTVPADNQQGCYTIERLPSADGLRFAIRIGKLAIYFSRNECAQMVEAITKLGGGGNPPVRL